MSLVGPERVRRGRPTLELADGFHTLACGSVTSHEASMWGEECVAAYRGRGLATARTRGRQIGSRRYDMNGRSVASGGTVNTRLVGATNPRTGGRLSHAGMRQCDVP